MDKAEEYNERKVSGRSSNEACFLSEYGEALPDWARLKRDETVVETE
jgi:hypothetical protein